MLLRRKENISVYCENHTKHIITTGQNADFFLMLKQVVHRLTAVHQRDKRVERTC
jgi:hypothetical protein